MADNLETSYAGRVGVELDVLLNVLAFDGQNGQTVSEHAATAESAGKPWGCIVCRLLSALVQTGHCQLVLAGDPTPTGAAVRALALILAAFGAIGFGADLALRAIL
jgi:hypothetical protein